jgi:A/G-specific adenine glycosylase
MALLPVLETSGLPPQELSKDAVLEIRERLLNWGHDNYREFPWRQRDIPRWQALLAEFLLLRTRATQVVPVFIRMRAEYPTAASLGSASGEQLLDLVAPLGLRWRGELFLKLASELLQSDGCIPLDEGQLRELPGVGEYVAAATLSLHAGRRAVLIDSNIVRLISRLVGAPFDGDTRRKRWMRELADRLTPETDFREYGYAILDHSMSVCRPRNPLCGRCPLSDLCASVREDGGRSP